MDMPKYIYQGTFEYVVSEGDYICCLFDLKCRCERAQRGQFLIIELVCSLKLGIYFILLRSIQW